MYKSFLIPIFFIVSYVCLGQTEVVKNVGDFTSLRVFDKIPVILIHSESPRIEIFGNKSEDVQVINKNGELKVRMSTLNLLSGDDTVVKIYYSEINNIETSEGSSVKSEEEIESQTLTLNAKEGAAITLTLNVEQLNIRVNSGGVINASGNTIDQNILITSGGKYLAKNLNSENANINLTAGGNSVIYASKSVIATTRAGGNIDIYGSAEVQQKSILGGTITVH
ncbi:DUF2807 domain-containing protein [Apibacter muscae]|uniref:DUF2807 domain-containing protein n=1 Tax=Apibacter muscae TaxID=2509004 RepID=A0A563DFY6_9FLAO|nr:head GIN domain-containing protein [Apibacter muscae]TWP28714.1 DUF2807 domain-containing protein [Apibacter muscae]